MILGNYKRDGFVILKGAVSAEETLSAQELSIMHREFKTSLTKSTDEYLSRVRLLGKSVAIHKLFSSQRIYEACVSLGCQMPVYVSDPAVHVTSEDLRIPGGYFGVGAHQDWPALQGSLDAITIWCPMHFVGREDYPMEFVPGSHLLGLLPAKVNPHWSEVDTTGMKFSAVECQRGDVILFSGFTVHRTRTPGRGLRVAVSQRYCNAAALEWKARNYRSAQSRMIDREIRYQPSVEDVRKIFAEPVVA